MSVVLEVQPDGSYEPTASEVVEYGKWLGMQLPDDEAFLWIAREGLKAPLPEHWKACKSERGDLYYFNFKTGESIWDHPLDEHYKELFRREKASPTPRSLAAAAATTPPPQAPAAVTKSKTSKSATQKKSNAAAATASDTTGTRALRSLKLKKQLPDELRIDAAAGSSTQATMAAAAVDACAAPHDATRTTPRDEDAERLAREHAAALQERRDAHAAQLRRVDDVLAQWAQYADAFAQAVRQAHDEARDAVAQTTRQLRHGVARVCESAQRQREAAAFADEACKAHEAHTRELHALAQATRDEVTAALRHLATRAPPPRVDAMVQTDDKRNDVTRASVCEAACQTCGMTDVATSPPRPQLDSTLLAQRDDDSDSDGGLVRVVATPRVRSASGGSDEVRSAVAEALRDVLLCTLASPATSPAAVTAAARAPMTPTTTPQHSTGASLRGLDALHDVEQRRVRRAQRQVTAERRLLDERARMLRQLRHDWKVDVMQAKRDGVRAASARGQALQHTRAVLDAHVRELERDTAALRQSEAWLQSKVAYLATLRTDKQQHAATPTTTAPLADALARIEQQLGAVRALIALQQRQRDHHVDPCTATGVVA